MAMTGRQLMETARQAVPKIENTQLQAQIASDTAPFILDVREKDEWDAGHIAPATFLPRGRLEGRIEELVPDKTTPIVTH
jgi:adenylyltransferase/sulfurtransferase